MAHHNELGKIGEELAREFLLSKGYLILELNWRKKRDEIDIIAKLQEFVVFVEVKTRRNQILGQPEKSVTVSKQIRIIRAAHSYLLDNDLHNEARFDIIGVTLNRLTKNIRHIPGAFVPNW